jgi:two-component system, sensor histidine kinase and response regulator
MNNGTLVKRKMLIIDDEKKLLLGLKAVMVREGFDVLTADEGEEGVQLAKEFLPDVIICDVMMPSQNGFQLKKLLTEDTRTAEIPFIFLTARTSKTDKLAGFNQGADDYITKPFNVDELVARVQAILRRNEIGRQSGLKEMESTLEKVKRSIATNLAHELRTPLGIILASLDLAIQEKYNGNTQDLDWYLQSSLSSAQKLSMLIMDLILLNDIDQGKLSKFRRVIDLDFRFHEPLHKVVNAYQGKNLNLEVTVDPGAVIHAPEVEFSHAISHLIDNACKFSPHGAAVSIHLAAYGIGGCSLVIENEGSSIPVELREKVFDRYYQIQQGDARPYGGLGVGLTVARAVAQACGGSVEILDSIVGCKVRMLIPPGPADWGITDRR